MPALIPDLEAPYYRQNHQLPLDLHCGVKSVKMLISVVIKDRGHCVVYAQLACTLNTTHVPYVTGGIHTLPVCH